MDFGLDKHRIMHTVKGKIKQDGYELQIETIAKLYKYFGIKQSHKFNHHKIKVVITKKSPKRL